MTADDDAHGGFSLRRWSRRKLDAARAASPASRAPATPVVSEPAISVPPATTGSAPAPAERDAVAAAAPAPLPPVDSLVFDSDFTPFLQPRVDETVKREALKKLFQDPRFNVMDRLDTYIDDYSLPDPIAPEVARQLLHMRSFFAPPKTRINAQGYVEDVPADEAPLPEAATEAPSGAALPAPEAAAPPASAADAVADAAAEADLAAPRAAVPDDGDPVHRDHGHPRV
jgi:hypothetical protein